MSENENHIRKKKDKKNKRSFKVLKIILLSFLSIFVIFLVALSGVVLATIKSAPDLNVDSITSLNEASKLYDNKGNYTDDVVTSEKRTVIPFNQMPQMLKDSFVSIEDERFYSHNGIDLKRISSVIYTDAVSLIKKQKNIQGASTITQQLIKISTLSSDVTFTRKIQEMSLALQLEKKLSKDQILEAYLNTIYLGGNAYGVEAAANQYFNKQAKDLTLIQCAFIAGINQSPSSFYTNVIVKKDPSKYLPRTETVIEKLHENNKITEKQYNQAISDLTGKKLVFDTSFSKTDKLNYEWFSLPVLDQVKSDLISQYNYSSAEVNALLTTGGLKIYTTMDKHLQDFSQDVLNNDPGLKAITTIDKKGISQPEASAVVMDYHSGQVKAIIGGRGVQPPGSYNRAAFNGTSTYVKPPGSNIKPLTVYGPAIDEKLASPSTVIEDSPLSPSQVKKYPNWNLTNYGESSDYYGYLTLREALRHSQNLVAVKLEDMIGLKTGVDYAQRFGIKLDIKDKSSIAALSLGELTYGTNTITMAAAYGTFGNNGNYTNARLYTKVVDSRGVTILESKTTNKQILTAQGSYIMYDMLKEPVSEGGTAPNANFGNMTVRGKTGTSSLQKNFWFSGLTPYYSGSVWVGDDNPKTYYASQFNSGGSAGLWSKIMAEANKGLPDKVLPMPSGIVTATICKDSGKLPTNLCSQDPRGNRVDSDYFISGTVPTSSCDIHVGVNINKSNYKLATEFTPSYLLEFKVFIKRDYVPSVWLKDEQYVVPTALDETRPVIPDIPIVPETPVIPNTDNTNTNNDTNNNKDNPKKSHTTPGNKNTPIVPAQ